MSLIRYSANPPRALQEEIKQVFDKFFSGDADDASSVVTSQWMPRVDIKEEADRKTEAVTESERYSRVERAHGVFYRRFALPDSANPEGVTATGRHGVLEIAIPKRPETTPRRIQVS